MSDFQEYKPTYVTKKLEEDDWYLVFKAIGYAMHSNEVVVSEFKKTSCHPTQLSDVEAMVVGHNKAFQRILNLLVNNEEVIVQQQSPTNYPDTSVV